MFRGKPTCLICSTSVCEKEYNIKRHYEMTHKDQYDKFTGEEGVEKQHAAFCKIRRPTSSHIWRQVRCFKLLYCATLTYPWKYEILPLSFWWELGMILLEMTLHYKHDLQITLKYLQTLSNMGIISTNYVVICFDRFISLTRTHTCGWEGLENFGYMLYSSIPGKYSHI